MSFANLINKKILVNYFDQNFDFEVILPLVGIISKKIKIDNADFFVITFEKSFFYKNREFENIVIKERHVGSHIGESGEVHVHVLLPKKSLSGDSYEFSEFDHVVWATVSNLS